VSNAEPDPVLHVPARDVPVPSSVSAEAQSFLAAGLMIPRPYPSLDDHDAWRRYVAEGDAAMAQMLEFSDEAASDVRVQETRVADAAVYVSRPQHTTADDRRVFLDVHGGGLIQGGGPLCRALGAQLAKRIGAVVWSVDYRMPPDHPFPAGVDDCLATYRTMLEEHHPEEIVIGGASAGGNLAAATVLRARDEGLPMPAAVVLLTPQIDLTESGDSFHANLGLDTVLAQSLMPANVLYAAGHDLVHPYVSPLFGDFTDGFPPTLLTAGTRDLFLSNAVRMHRSLRAAGVQADLYLVEAGPHAAFFGLAPEDRALDDELRRFLDRHWARRSAA